MRPATAVQKAYTQAISNRALTERSDSLEASFGCGCIVPWANLQPGERILDLGSGTGSDCLEAAAAVGADGVVVGIDFTPEMLRLAASRVHATELNHVQFIRADISALPMSAGQVDVVLSNCTLNLVHDRPGALKEAFRVLRPGGRLLISEIVVDKPFEATGLGNADLFVNCISGASSLKELVFQIKQAGFVDVTPVRIASLTPSVSTDELSRLDRSLASVLLRGRKADEAVSEPIRSGNRILMFGASDAAIASAREYGLNPIVLTKPESDIPVLDAFDVIPFNSPEEATSKCRHSYKNGEIRGVVALDGPYVGIASALSRHFDGACYFPAQIVEGGENKFATNHAMASAGVSVPRYWFGNRVPEALDWANSIGWPVVAKPANDANSRLVRLCRNFADLSVAFDQILSTTRNVGGLPLVPGVLLEQFIEGPEFSVEIIVPSEQPPIVVAACEKLLGPEPFFVEIGHAIPCSLRPASLRAVKSMATRAVEAIGVRNIVCHVEVRLGEDGPYVIEVNLRPPGGRLPDLIRVVSGWDLPRAAVELACGLHLHTPSKNHAPCGIYHCITADVEAVIRYDKQPLEIEGVRVSPYVEMDVSPETHVYPVNHPNGRILGRILAFGETPSDVWNVIRTIKKSLNLSLTPSGANEHVVNDKVCSGCWETGCC